MPEIDRLDQLSAKLELRSLRFREVSAKAKTQNIEKQGPIFSLEITVEEENEARARYQDSDQNETFRLAWIALKVELNTKEGRLVVEPEGLYAIPEEFSSLLEPTLLGEYVNNEALFTLMPFAREAIFDLSMRVFQKRIMMPLFMPGELKFELSDN